jgi:serine/threonine protein kinase
MELCTRGSLYDILNDPSVHIGWKQVFGITKFRGNFLILIGFAQQMVRGLQILHNAQPQVLHRDVKSMNFLVDKDWVVKGNALPQKKPLFFKSMRFRIS